MLLITINLAVWLMDGTLCKLIYIYLNILNYIEKNLNIFTAK